jgi:hypothetical protein
MPSGGFCQARRARRLSRAARSEASTALDYRRPSPKGAEAEGRRLSIERLGQARRADASHVGTAKPALV